MSAVRLRFEGTEPDLERLLALVHVRATVLGVVEGGSWLEIAIAGDAVCELPSDLRARVSCEQSSDDAGPWPTGLENDTAIRVGERILVRPPWVRPLEDFDGFELVVPREMAFGSGEHASTQAALCLMERMWTDRIESVADVGAGSGILALYANARGCQRIEACDTDPVAVKAARALLPEAAVVLGGPDGLPGTCDAVVSNMREDELRECLADIVRVWNGRGPLIVSGVRDEQTGPIGEAREPGLVGGFSEAIGRAPGESIRARGFSAWGWV